MKEILFFRRCFVVFLLAFFSQISVYSQLIMTVAGGGTISGDGEPAVEAALGTVADVCFDSTGNYYFLEEFAKIRMVDVAGNIHTIVGNGSIGYSGDGGPATAAELDMQGFAFDRKGNIYISDFYNYRIRKVDISTHIITTIAGNGTADMTGSGGLAISAECMPSGICIDSIGNIYVVDSGGYHVRKIDTDGIITTVAGNGTGGDAGDGGQATAAELAISASLCMDRSGNIYLPCAAKIRKINIATGIISTYAGNGNPTYIGDGMPATMAQFAPYIINMDTTNDNLYIADNGYAQNRVYKVDASGIFHLIAGNGTSGFSGDGGIDTLAELDYPEGVATDGCGNLYIADEANSRIRKVTFPDTASISLSGPATAAPASSVTVSASVSGAGTYTLHWYDNGTLVATTAIPSFTFTMSGTTDTITATIISTGGCYDSVTSASHIITANDNAVQQMSASSILIYPNPAHDMLTITGAIGQAQLSNAIGQVLLTRQSTTYKTIVDISTLPVGMYLLTTTGPDNSKVTSKIVKE